MFYPLLLLMSWLTCCTNSAPPPDYKPLPEEKIAGSKIAEAQLYCKNNAYDTSVCFLIDLSLHNGRKRFFIYDLEKNKIINSGLVTHGSCNTRYLPQVQYSNKAGCGCSSYGKYKVGSFYKGVFGDAYKLHGLDSTNSNAYNRYIVLHAHSCVPDAEIYPDQICNSQGCTTVSPAFLKELEKVISKKKKPVLLWVLG